MISLRRLGAGDAELLHSMLQANAEHLTQRGDFTDEVALTFDDVRARFADAIVRFAIEDDARPVGHLALVPVDPPHWTVGYWVAADHVGRGVCTAAVRLAFGEARALGALDLYAGVTTVVAVSAPSSLAVEAAQRLGVCLVAFGGNVYAHAERLA